MNRLCKFLTFSTLAVTLGGCVESIPFSTSGGSKILVVDGTFHNLNDSQRIRLTYTADYGNPPTAVENALIKVTDSDGKTATYQADPTQAGFYRLAPNILRGQVGKSYKLNIQLPNGEMWQTDAEPMLPSVRPDSMRIEVGKSLTLNDIGVVVSSDVLNVYISTPLKDADGTPRHLHWTVREVYQWTTFPECNFLHNTTTCYFDHQTSPQLISIAAPSTGVTRADNMKVAVKPLNQYDVSLMEIQYFNVFQQTISPAAYTYWQQVNAASNPTGSIFDAAPGAVFGNIYKASDKTQRALGYFEVSSVEIKRLRSLDYELRVLFPALKKKYDMCGYLFGNYTRDYFRGCCDCLQAGKGGSYAKPNYWQ